METVRTIVKGPEGPVEATFGLGWIRDRPDHRDYTMDTSSVSTLLRGINADRPRPDGELPTRVDLREWCTPIEDQGALGSCTAQAGLGLLEFYERKASGTYVDGSRLFLYKATRDLMGWTGDTGAYLRTTMGAMVLLGAPPEKYWPYDVERFDEQPPTFAYSAAKEYKAAQFYRLDPPGTSADDLLARIRTELAASMPSMFGFTVFSSIRQAGQTGEIPVPGPREKATGGHAVVAVGYDDDREIAGEAGTSTGALLIRNSWGVSWGDEGYGWLPYDYIRRGLAVDWWTLIEAEWVATGQFGLDL